MTKETLREIGKLSFDIAKIIFAIAILTPLIKSTSINYYAVFGSIFFIAGGIILINKGTKDE